MSNNKRYCFTKADLADALYAAVPVDKQKSSQLVEEFIELIKKGLEKEGKVMLSGFGCFEVKYKPARRGRNPQTGETITLRERKVIKFKPSQLLRKAINSPHAAQMMAHGGMSAGAGSADRDSADYDSAEDMGDDEFEK